VYELHDAYDLLRTHNGREVRAKDCDPINGPPTAITVYVGSCRP